MERTNKTLKAEMEEMVEIIESFSHHILKRMDISIFDLDKDDVDTLAFTKDLYEKSISLAYHQAEILDKMEESMKRMEQENKEMKGLLEDILKVVKTK